MSKFWVYVRQTSYVEYEIEAESEDDARDKIESERDDSDIQYLDESLEDLEVIRVSLIEAED